MILATAFDQLDKSKIIRLLLLTVIVTSLGSLWLASQGMIVIETRFLLAILTLPVIVSVAAVISRLSIVGRVPNRVDSLIPESRRRLLATLTILHFGIFAGSMAVLLLFIPAIVSGQGLNIVSTAFIAITLLMIISRLTTATLLNLAIIEAHTRSRA